jgi:shikimate kinase
MNKGLKHNIILIGFMGSGKTSVGKRLADRLSYRFQDTDQMIEQKAGDTISHIFQTRGEEYFRDLETGLLKELHQKLHQTVLSTGGGLPLREQNAKLLKELGYVVYLKASKETTIKRLQGDISRPLLQGDDLERKVEHLLSVRASFYEKVSSKVIATDDRDFDEIINLIMESYMKQIY